MKSLQRLNLSVNHLTCIPDEIQDLQQLTVLDLNHNQISHLPEALGNLEKLDVRLNKQLRLPSWLFELEERDCTVFF